MPDGDAIDALDALAEALPKDDPEKVESATIKFAKNLSNNPSPEQRMDVARAKAAEQVAKRLKQETKLRRRYAAGLMLILTVQILVTNAVFVIYAIENKWGIPTTAISVWIGGTVVELISVALAITNSIFPKDGGWLGRVLANTFAKG